jgi:preprotein translocase subunit SecA
MSFDKFLTKLFGSSNQRFLKSIGPMVQEINSFESSVKALSDDQLRAKTAEFKERVQRAVGDTKDKEERKRRERAVLDDFAGGFCHRPRGQYPHDRHAPL